MQELAFKESDEIKGGKPRCKFMKDTRVMMINSYPQDTIKMSVKGSIVT